MTREDGVPVVQPLFDAGMHMAMCFPVKQKDQVLAIIFLGYREPENATGDVIARDPFLSALVGHTGATA